MEELYGLHHPSAAAAGGFPYHHHHQGATLTEGDLQSLVARIPGYGPAGQLFVPSTAAAPAISEASMVAGGCGGAGIGGGGEIVSSAIKAKIASHPRYPRLLEAYIDCQKVGVPPEIASLLDEIVRRQNDASKRYAATGLLLGADPELDEFMETYREVLVKCRSDLSRPFDEAANFLNSVEVQLSSLCSPPAGAGAAGSDEAAGSSEEEFSGGEADALESYARGEDGDIKEKLLRKYSGYISSLKQEFSKKKKKGKLPKEARQTLLDWWNAHYKWPYPTEADKIALAESTGLDQKQINNWFINQRKRHWKPSESMQFAVMDSLSAPIYLDGLN